MSLHIPNTSDAAFADQAEPDKVHFDILSAAYAGTGVVSGCAVTAQGTPDMTVAVAAGRVAVSGVEVAVASGNVTITAANATNPRFDLIVVNNTGTKSATAGTAAADPVYPAIPANSAVLAAVYVPANDTAINSNQIYDHSVEPVVFPGARVYRTTSQSIANSTDVAIQFDNEDYDNGGFHDNATNNTRLTAPRAGRYRITGQIRYASNATGNRDVVLRKNATVELGAERLAAISGDTTICQATTDVTLAATDYVEVIARQNSGGSLNADGLSGNNIGIGCWATISYIGK